MPARPDSLLIAVIGGAQATPRETSAAETVGRALAEAGAVLVCGGRGGVMEAACRGAKLAGGLTLGILPGADRTEANVYVDLPIATRLGAARNALVACSAQAVIAIGGSYGTLSEIAFALRLGTPVVGLWTWKIQREGHPAAPIVYMDTPKEAALRALELARRGQA